MEDMMQKQAHIPFLKYFLRFDEFNDEIDDALHRLEFCIKRFSVGLLLRCQCLSSFNSSALQIQMELKIMSSVDALKRSRLQDMAYFQNLFHRILGNHSEILRLLNLRGKDQEDEAMIAMQKVFQQLHHDISSELNFAETQRTHRYYRNRDKNSLFLEISLCHIESFRNSDNNQSMAGYIK